MKKILLVDDDESFRRMLRLTLIKKGYEVLEAANGHDALRLQPIYGADLLLTDLIMPDHEGLETIRDFRREYPAVKIIAMSGGGRIAARDFLHIAEAFGAARTLAKPFSTDEMMIALEDVLRPHAKDGPHGTPVHPVLNKTSDKENHVPHPAG